MFKVQSLRGFDYIIYINTRWRSYCLQKRLLVDILLKAFFSTCLRLYLLSVLINPTIFNCHQNSDAFSF